MKNTGRLIMSKIEKNRIKKEEMSKEKIVFYNNYINDIRSRMDRPDFLGTFTDDDLEYLLDHNSHIYLFNYDNDVVCTSMIIPASEKDIKKFGLDLDFNEVIDYGPEVVLDSYRGNGLQGYMLEDLDSISKDLGYKYAVATIHPENVFSINNFLKHDFKKVYENNFERGPRNIYLKKLR